MFVYALVWLRSPGLGCYFKIVNFVTDMPLVIVTGRLSVTRNNKGHENMRVTKKTIWGLSRLSRGVIL